MRLLIEIEFDDEAPPAIIIDRLDLAPPYEPRAVEATILSFVAKNALALLAEGQCRCIRFEKTDGRPTRRERAAQLREAEPIPEEKKTERVRKGIS